MNFFRQLPLGIINFFHILLIIALLMAQGYSLHIHLGEDAHQHESIFAATLETQTLQSHHGHDFLPLDDSQNHIEHSHPSLPHFSYSASHGLDTHKAYAIYEIEKQSKQLEELEINLPVFILLALLISLIIPLLTSAQRFFCILISPYQQAVYFQPPLRAPPQA